MNRQRKVVITTTYNELGIIIDTKAEELDSSAQPNLQPTCNQLATDTISRQAAIRWVKTECNPYGKPTLDFESGKKVIEHLEQMPSAQPEIIYCKDCKHRKFVDFGMGDCLHPSGCRRIAFDNHFCALGERRNNE